MIKASASSQEEEKSTAEYVEAAEDLLDKGKNENYSMHMDSSLPLDPQPFLPLRSL
jgi:hypothetical protein